MEKLQLSFISASNERIALLLDGTVDVEGIDLMWTNSDPSETFWRQLKFEEFEVCEMSFSSLLIFTLCNVESLLRTVRVCPATIPRTWGMYRHPT